MPENKDALVEGRFAADEADDNSIDTSNPAYIGVDPEYRNHADYPDVEVDGEAPASNAPEFSEDSDVRELQERAAAHGQVVDGPHGYTTKTAEAGGLTPASPYSAGAQQASPAAEEPQGGSNEPSSDEGNGGTQEPSASPFA